MDVHTSAILVSEYAGTSVLRSVRGSYPLLLNNAFAYLRGFTEIMLISVKLLRRLLPVRPLISLTMADSETPEQRARFPISPLISKLPKESNTTTMRFNSM